MTISRGDVEAMRTELAQLSRHLLELNTRISPDEEHARRSLTEAFHHFNRLAHLVDPRLVVAEEYGRPDEKEGGEA